MFLPSKETETNGGHLLMAKAKKLWRLIIAIGLVVDMILDYGLQLPKYYRLSNLNQDHEAKASMRDQITAFCSQFTSESMFQSSSGEQIGYWMKTCKEISKGQWAGFKPPLSNKWHKRQLLCSVRQEFQAGIFLCIWNLT